MILLHVAESLKARYAESAEIQRDIYLGQLLDRMGNGMIKVVTGVGSSTRILPLFVSLARACR
ncbi:hypothetical protein [Mobiluncus mulieris]|uniref:hypothetical protein n=1 Tax=Mobiluncus mulieris TaxID=2052 RepID=UPI0009D6B749|nr:hypothetical protein [Mobiluncus mulieris]